MPEDEQEPEEKEPKTWIGRVLRKIRNFFRAIGRFFKKIGKAIGGFFGKLFSATATSQQGINLILGFLPLMIVAMIASTPLAKKLFVRGEDNAARGWGRILVTAVLMVLCVAALASQSYNPFIYFRF